VPTGWEARSNEMRTLRKIVEIRRFERIISQNTRRKCNAQETGECIERRDEWNDQVSRMAAQRILITVRYLS
jgi:hypothetical protein